MTDEVYEKVNRFEAMRQPDAPAGLAAASGSAIPRLDQDALEHGCMMPEDALKYAQGLAMSMWEKHWKQDSPNWKPLDDIVGVLTQIDNMVAGMTRRSPNDRDQRPANNP